MNTTRKTIHKILNQQGPDTDDRIWVEATMSDGSHHAGWATPAELKQMKREQQEIDWVHQQVQI